MKTKFQKTLCIMLIILTLFSFSYTNIVYASEEENVEEETEENEFGLGDVFDGVTGILLYPARAVLLAASKVTNIVTSEVADMGAKKGTMVISLDSIFFHNGSIPTEKRLPILDVNFFNSKDKNIKSGGVIGPIRNNIATWYYAIRNLAITISLLVLIYIGIRMAISTLADDKVKYKKMLTDWIVGFITIFLLHYIMILTINVNEAIVRAISPSTDNAETVNYMNKLFNMGLKTPSFVKGMAASIVYCGMTLMIFSFLYIYIKRMITVAFLIIIAPLITVTYSIDRVGDRKSTSIE